MQGRSLDPLKERSTHNREYTIKPYPPRPADGNIPGPTRETGNITGGNTVFQAGRGYPPRGSRVSLSLGPLKGVFYPNLAFFHDLAQQSPHELTHVRASPGDWAAGSWAQAWRKVREL